MILHAPGVPHFLLFMANSYSFLKRQLKDQPFWNIFLALLISLVLSIRDFISITTASQKIHYQRKGILEGLDKNHVINLDLSKEFKL